MPALKVFNWITIAIGSILLGYAIGKPTLGFGMAAGSCIAFAFIPNHWFDEK